MAGQDGLEASTSVLSELKYDFSNDVLARFSDVSSLLTNKQS